MRRVQRAVTSPAIAAMFFCFALAVPQAAPADELTRASNTAFALTVLDMATTRLSIAHTNGVETNPVARPFVRSDIGAFGYAILTTAVERIIFRRHPRAFLAVDGVEAYASIHNYADRLHALALTHAAEQTAPAAQP